MTRNFSSFLVLCSFVPFAYYPPIFPRGLFISLCTSQYYVGPWLHHFTLRRSLKNFLPAICYLRQGFQRSSWNETVLTLVFVISSMSASCSRPSHFPSFYHHVAGSNPDEDIFPIYVISPAALWPRVDSASNRNKYQEYYWGTKRGRRVSLTTSPPSLSRLSR
jgi:hypothetical protein